MNFLFGKWLSDKEYSNLLLDNLKIDGWSISKDMVVGDE